MKFLDMIKEWIRIKKKLPVDIVMGPMNGPKDKHPITIRSTCKILKTPLPEKAVCKYQPCHYIKSKKLDGELDTIRGLLGKRMPRIEEEELVRQYEMFKAKFATQKNLIQNNVNFTVYFCEWIMYAYTRGFSDDDYFDFELYNKEPEIRDTFVDRDYRLFVYEMCTPEKHRKTFWRKATFNRKFSEFVKRDWIYPYKAEFEEFQDFLNRHERFFVKPVGKSGGQGAEIMESSQDTPENLYEYCRQERLIVEEIIDQHPLLAEFNESTLNTVRVITFLPLDKEPRVLMAAARFGRAGNVVDNFHSNGLGAVVDIETGRIISEAIDQNHVRTPIHPDSKKMIVGFQYPEWDKIIEKVKQAALIVPQVRHVGWDLAVTKDGNVEIVEGNSRPGLDVLQSPDQIGRKYLYEEYVKALAKKKKLKAPNRKKIAIDKLNKHLLR